MLLNALGELGNLLALGFAPASVVTPVGAVGVVFNAVFASLFLKEPFRKIDLVGLLLIVTGIVVVVLCSKESNVQLTVQEAIDSYFNRTAFYVYVALLCGSCAWLVTLYKKGLGSQYMSMCVQLQLQRCAPHSSPFAADTSCSAPSSAPSLCCRVKWLWAGLPCLLKAGISSTTFCRTSRGWPWL